MVLLQVEISLSRDECRSEASVKIHSTRYTFLLVLWSDKLSRVSCIVTGEIIAPYPDRPNEGILQFSADVSNYAEVGHILLCTSHCHSKWESLRHM